MSALKSVIFITFDINTKDIEFIRNDNITDYDTNTTNIYIQSKYTKLDGETVYLSPSEIENYNFSLYTIKPLTNEVSEITGKVTNELTEQVRGGVIKFVIPKACTNRSGIVKCELHINKEKEMIASTRFILDVQQSLVTKFNNSLLEDEDFPVLTQLILEIQKASNINDSAASSVTTYSGNKIENIKEDLSSQIKEMAKIRKINNNTTTKMIAHRGLSSKAPENTLPAYIEASKAGYWGGESDVIQTKDLQYVMFHDDTADRMTNGTGNIKDMTLEQIKSLTINSGSNISQYPNLKIPTLDEYVSCCRTNNLVPIIEVKYLSNYDHFMDKIKELGLQNDGVFMCFAKSVNEYIRQHFPNVKIQQLYNVGQVTSSEIVYCSLNNFDIDCYYSDVNIDLIKECKANGVELNCWTLDNQDKANELINMNIDYITTNLCVNENSIDYKINTITANKGINNNDNTLYKKLAFVSRSGEDLPFSELWSVVNTKRCSSLSKIYIPNNIDRLILSIPESLNLTLNFFDKNDKFIADVGWLSNGYYYPPYNAKYFTPYWKKADNSEFCNEDLFDIYSTDISIKKMLPDWNIFNVYNYRANGVGSSFYTNFNATDNTRLISREKMIVKDNLTINISVPTGYNATLMPFGKNNLRIADLGWSAGGQIELPSNTYYFALYWKKVDNSNFTANDILKCKNETYIF